MLYDTVLPGVEPLQAHVCSGCEVEFNGPRVRRKELEQSLDGPAEDLRKFLSRYGDMVDHDLSNCPLTNVRAALIAISDDTEEALLWETTVRTKLGEPLLPDSPAVEPD
ncbi:hypothetical protein OG588_30940 [Streptomyces prunicolor]|uniref:hypothetical protein n=1 Tax=Streptomyces prunicolor TaxID=67348 RepID=UPI00386ECF06|nr:hypothetical protein OG588_30940 [Streptomyces prunicolor]